MSAQNTIGAVTGAPRAILRFENAAILGLAVVAYRLAGGEWLMFGLLFLAPDLSMLGYLGGRRIGAAAYNFAHSYVAPAVVLAGGLFVDGQLFTLIGLIWAAHIGFDRAIGYGLKYSSSFVDTHLGRAPFAPK